MVVGRSVEQLIEISQILVCLNLISTVGGNVNRHFLLAVQDDRCHNRNISAQTPFTLYFFSGFPTSRFDGVYKV